MGGGGDVGIVCFRAASVSSKTFGGSCALCVVWAGYGLFREREERDGGGGMGGYQNVPVKIAVLVALAAPYSAVCASGHRYS